MNSQKLLLQQLDRLKTVIDPKERTRIFDEASKAGMKVHDVLAVRYGAGVATRVSDYATAEIIARMLAAIGATPRRRRSR